MLYNALPTTSENGEEITLDGTAEVTFKKIDLKGNTSQTGTPTPDNPINIDVVTGNNSIKVEGKNLFDTTKYNTTEKVTVLDNEDGVLELQGISGWYQGVNQEFDVISNQHYILSYNAQKINTNAGIIVIVKEEDNITELGRNSSTGVQTISFTPTTGKINVFFRANFETSTGHTKYSNIQLELGNQSSQYTPYQGQTYPINIGNIELCKIGNYQDYIYKDSGKWYLNKQIGKVVLNGSEDWAISNNIFYRTQSSYVGVGYNTISNYFIGGPNQASTTNVNNYNPNNSICCASSGTNRFYIKTNIASTTTDFKTWLSTHNTDVYYVLATPTTTEITDSTLISQLEALKNAYSYDTQTNISQTNQDKPFIISYEAILSLKNILNSLETRIAVLETE